jgi:hypothetical protein
MEWEKPIRVKHAQRDLFLCSAGWAMPDRSENAAGEVIIMKQAKVTIYILMFYSLVFSQVIPYNQEFRVNTYYLWDQEYPELCQLSDSGFVICWNSDYQDDGDCGIYGQIYNKDGSKRRTEFQVNVYSEGDQWARSSYVCGLKNGGFVVCWHGPDPDHGGRTIRARIFENNGENRKTEFRVNIKPYNGYNPSITELQDGGFVICWLAADDMGYGIFMQVFNPDGSRRGDESRVNQSYWNDTPCINSLRNGGFVVCWRNGAANWIWESRIIARIYDSNGIPGSDEFIVTEITGFVHNNPCISDFDEDRFVVCWERLTLGENYNRETYGYAQIFNNNGEEISDEILINSHPFLTGKYNTGSLDVTKIINSGFLICWPQFIENRAIYCQFFDSDGNYKENYFRITRPEAWGGTPRVCEYMNGGFVACWTDWQQDGSQSGIAAKFYVKEIKHDLNPFYLLEPDYDEILYSTSSIFKWSHTSSYRVNLPWELEYTLYLDENDSFSSPMVIDSIYDTTYAVQNLIPGTTYFWKLLAKNKAGDSLWSSETNGFFISQSLIPFSLIQPKTDETIKITNPSFKWNHASGQSFSSPWELEYHLYLDKNENFTNPQICSVARDTIFSAVYLSPGTTYYWKVLAKDFRNDSLWSSETNLFYVSEDATTSIQYPVSNSPKAFELYANYPNPFNPETTIKYNLLADQSVYSVKIKIDDALGQLITTLINEPQNSGLHSVKWNGKNTTGQNIPSGIYYCMMETGRYKATQKIVLVR